MGDTQLSPKPLHALPGPGSELGQYRIIELLGAGGMGQVFLAEHKRLGRRVALKLLLPQFAGNAEVIARFFHEAKAVNQINHAHIVEIVDFVEDPNGYNYFIMELLEGRDLATTREHEGPFTVGRVVRIGRQIASALTATHRHGIVHRDLKPENIFLIERDGKKDFVKILDFGIAKLSAAEAGEDRPKTRAGMVLGTPEYMSPEQAGGQLIDARSDLYSLGIILYWMLTDRLPFRGESMGEILVKQLTEPPPPLPAMSASGESLPGPLVQMTEKLLKRDPAQRLQTTAEVLERFKALDETDISGVAPALPAGVSFAPSPRPLYIALGAIAAIGVAAAGYFALRPAPREAPVAPALAAPSPAAALPTLSPMPPLPAAPTAAPVPAPAPEPAAAKAKAELSKPAAGPHPKAKKKKTSKDDNSGMINPFDE